MNPLARFLDTAFTLGINSLESPVRGRSSSRSGEYDEHFSRSTRQSGKCFSIHYGSKTRLASQCLCAKRDARSLLMANPWMQTKALTCISLFLTLVPLASHLEAKVTKSVFGNAPDGTKVELYTLEEGAIKARIMTYGARLVSLEVPDRSGKVADIVLGYESLDGYTADPKSYFESIVGRYGNRIAHATFTLDGKRYDLPANDGVNTLHGGTKGFDRLVWKGQEIPQGVELTLVSKDGDQGFPGTLTARVRYTLEAHALKIEYFATTDK